MCQRIKYTPVRRTLKRPEALPVCRRDSMEKPKT